MGKKFRYKLLNCFGFVLSILIFIFFIYSVINYSKLHEMYFDFLELNYFVIFLATIFLESFPQLASPSLILTSAVFMGVGIHKIIFVIAIASFVGSVLGFFIGYFYTEKVIEMFVSDKNKRSERIKRLFERYGKFILFFIAITPLPYFPIIFGTLKVDIKNFLYYGAIARSISYIVYGYGFYFLLYYFQLSFLGH